MILSTFFFQFVYIFFWDFLLQPACLHCFFVVLFFFSISCYEMCALSIPYTLLATFFIITNQIEIYSLHYIINIYIHSINCVSLLDKFPFTILFRLEIEIVANAEIKKKQNKRNIQKKTFVRYRLIKRGWTPKMTIIQVIIFQ